MATAAQAQSITGLSYQLPRDKGIPKVASQYKKSSVATAPGQLNTNGSIQSSGAITEKLMEKPSAQIPSKATSDVLMSANEVGRDTSMSTPSGANDQAAAKVGEKINHDGLGKIQRGDDSTANKETQGSHSSTKSKAVAKQRPNAQSSTEEGEITSKPTVPLNRIPVQESTPKPASHKKTPPTRVSTLTNIAPTGPRAKRQVSVSKALEATSALEHGGGQGDAGADAHSSAPWSHGKHGNGLASLSARRGRLDHGDHGDHMTWEAYKAPPPAHHVYARPSGEQRPPSPSPMASRLFGVGDWEVQRFVSRDPDLQDWLHLTGWYHPEYRKHELARLRRREEIERESIELRKEGELEKAQLKGECGEPSSEARLLSNAGARPLLLPPAPPQLTDDVEPAEYRMLGRYTVTAGTKRERGEENNDDDDDDDDDAADGGFSAKYCRTSPSPPAQVQQPFAT
ncbi:hypothetical protein UCDDA912_g01223 [Diaporthe ampelina]|uniref:Uncharacterized protein n=1 Tax=Diaporthe ampelina TaxID=1214573 RepID=A0A0G2FX71_9PEZI|nr:hypothetical protein UCDDA912_g01223 [Diaporthe ampelina]